MIKVSIEVSRGNTCYRISVRAASLRRALEIAGAGKPGWNLAVVTPIGATSTGTTSTGTTSTGTTSAGAAPAGAGEIFRRVPTPGGKAAPSEAA